MHSPSALYILPILSLHTAADMNLSYGQHQSAILWDSFSLQTKVERINSVVDVHIGRTMYFLMDLNELAKTCGGQITSRAVTADPYRPWDYFLDLIDRAPWTRALVKTVCEERAYFRYEASRVIASDNRVKTSEERADQIEEYKYLTFEAALLRRVAQAAAGFEHHIDHLFHVTVTRRWRMLLVEGAVDHPHQDMSRDWSNWAMSLECCEGQHLGPLRALKYERGSEEADVAGAGQLVRLVTGPGIYGMARRSGPPSEQVQQVEQGHAVDSSVQLGAMPMALGHSSESPFEQASPESDGRVDSDEVMEG